MEDCYNTFHRSGSYANLKQYAMLMLYNSTNLYIRGTSSWDIAMDLATVTAQSYAEEGRPAAISSSPKLALDLLDDNGKFVILVCALSDVEDLQSLLLLQSSNIAFCLYGEDPLDPGLLSSFITLDIQ